MTRALSISLEGRSAIVTGGARGVGYGICEALASAGAELLVVDLDEAGAGAAADRLSASGATVRAYTADVSDEEATRRVVEECVHHFGGLDILVNNAGIYPNRRLLAMTLSEFQSVIDTNLVGTFLYTRLAAEQMIAQGHGGRIINITSINALRPTMLGLAHYDASKHGALGFTKSAALELAEHRISVNAIACGGILTPGVDETQSPTEAVDEVDRRAILERFLDTLPMHRMGDPREIGNVAAFLASDLASYLTGTQIVVDGGAMLL